MTANTNYQGEHTKPTNNQTNQEIKKAMRNLPFTYLLTISSLLLRSASTLHLPSLSSLLHPDLSLPSAHNFSLPSAHNFTLPPILTYNTRPAVCHTITSPPMPPISNSKCAFLAGEICQHLATTRPVIRNQWVWEQHPKPGETTPGEEIPGCALGYYLPDGAEVPHAKGCEDLLYDRVRFVCLEQGDGVNAGSLNVGVLPGREGDGTAVVEGEGRWIIAPKRLTVEEGVEGV